MEGKIVLEEHFGPRGTLGNAGRFSQPGFADDMARRLPDFEELRLPEMDEYGIEFALQSFQSPGVQAVLETEAAVEMAARANDTLAEEITKRPDRFGGLATLPMQDTDAATQELTRCIRELGFKGIMVNGFTQRDDPDNILYLDLPEYRPFWACVAEMDVPFYLHPRNPPDSQLRAYEGHPWLQYSPWAFAQETAIHTLRLLASGLFDEFPNIQLVVGHMGERIPFDLWRLDHRIRKSPQGIPAKKSMTDYWLSNVHVTTSGHFYTPALDFTIQEMGIDRVLFSVDYPFETTDDAVGWFDNAELSDADRLQIGRTNAIKLFKLDLT